MLCEFVCRSRTVRRKDIHFELRSIETSRDLVWSSYPQLSMICTARLTPSCDVAFLISSFDTVCEYKLEIL